MDYTKRFDSEHFNTDGLCHRIMVTIDLEAYAEDDYGFEITELYDVESDVYRDLKDFPINEQKKIEKLAENLASENAYEAYMEQMISMADSRMDSWD